MLDSARDELAEREQAAARAEQAHLAAVAAVADRREGLARLTGQIDTLAHAGAVRGDGGRRA